MKCNIHIPVNVDNATDVFQQTVNVFIYFLFVYVSATVILKKNIRLLFYITILLKYNKILIKICLLIALHCFNLIA